MTLLSLKRINFRCVSYRDAVRCCEIDSIVVLAWLLELRMEPVSSARDRSRTKGSRVVVSNLYAFARMHYYEMKISSTHSKHCDFLFIAVIVASRISFAQAPATARTTSAASEAGQNRFLQDCAFCHGRDAQGGETGPDLTRSKLVADDVNGDKIGPVVRNGRPEKGMPRFTVSDPELVALATFLHQQKKLAESRQGGRRGVDVQDLQTGNVSAGKAYFNGAGTCSQCHSVTGDLAGIAKKYQGLKLEQNFLHPPNIKAKIELVDPSGQVVKGTIAYRDEFTIALIDSSGWYRSWPADRVKYKIDDPGEVHANLLEKYTDEDVHNVMAYLQTLQ